MTNLAVSSFCLKAVALNTDFIDTLGGVELLPTTR